MVFTRLFKGKLLKNKHYFARQFNIVYCLKKSHPRPLPSASFPQGFKSLKVLDIWLQEVGAKKHLNGTSKSEQTNTHTDKSIYRKHLPRGPMLWKSGVTIWVLSHFHPNLRFWASSQFEFFVQTFFCCDFFCWNFFFVEKTRFVKKVVDEKSFLVTSHYRHYYHIGWKVCMF